MMTEMDRLKSGKLFDARSRELLDMKHRAHELCREYNALGEWDPRRNEIIGELFAECGEKCLINGPMQFNYGVNTHIGKNFFANFNFTVLDDGPVHIGDNVMMGPNVSIMCACHPLLAEEREATAYPDGHTGPAEYSSPIRIGSHVWIACGVTICAGVTIGEGAVIGAGSVVTEDMPAGWLSAGVPCRPIRKLTEKDSRKDLV